MSTASTGRAREHRVRDILINHGWSLVARSAGSKGPADLVVVHPDHGLALVQVGTGNKTLGPADRTRFLDLADLCSALPLVALCVPRLPVKFLCVNEGPASTWEGYNLYEPVICGQRETRMTGTWECINPVGCDGGHYYVLLNQKPQEKP